jgi:hypothetical protein
MLLYIAEHNGEYLAEEAAHYVHWCSNNFYSNKKSKAELETFRIIEEAIGFLCSKFFYPNRVNEFGGLKDYHLLENGQRKIFLERLVELAGGVSKAKEVLIYQQGYGLGERMYEAYMTGKLSKQRIRNLLRKSFRKEKSVFNEYHKLLNEFWSK